MVSDYRPFRPQASPHIPHSSNDSFFIQQLHSVSSMRSEELGRDLHQPFYGYHHQQIAQPHHYPYTYPNPNPNPNPNSYPYPYHHPSPYAHDMHAAIQREIEKEKIREEIIMSEIMRRRELEAEVRRELMMERELVLSAERELVLRRGNQGVSFGAPSVTEIDSPKRPLEERILPSIMDRERLNGRLESGGLEPLPFQRRSADVRNSEVIPIVEIAKEKERINLGAKPNENTCGTKREASTVDATESPSGGKARKKAKEEWSCALCKVSINSQQALNEHLKGKKHKTKEAALKGAKKFSIGLLSKKPVTAIPVYAPVTGKKVKVLSKKPATAIPVDPPVTGNKVKVSLDKSKKDANKLNKKEKCTFWCELCQVAAPSLKGLNNHRKGKKHTRRLMSNNNCGDGKLAENGGAVYVIELDDGSTKADVTGET